MLHDTCSKHTTIVPFSTLLFVLSPFFPSSQVHDNIGYGLDPHDDSDHLTIHNNHVYNNGWHGISESSIQSIPTSRENKPRKTFLHCNVVISMCQALSMARIFFRKKCLRCPVMVILYMRDYVLAFLLPLAFFAHETNKPATPLLLPLLTQYPTLPSLSSPKKLPSSWYFSQSHRRGVTT